jgi:DNA-binding NarL/FixJ family response regulator
VSDAAPRIESGTIVQPLDRLSLVRPTQTAASGPRRARTGIVRVMLIGDLHMIRSGLRLLLERDPDLCVVGEAGEWDDPINIAVRERPDVAVMDVDGVTNHDLLGEIAALVKKTSVILIGANDDAATLAQIFRTGARGFVRKHQASDVLLTAIKKVHAGEVWIERRMVGHVVAKLSEFALTRVAPPRNAPPVTRRDAQIIALVAQGMRNSEIAEQLLVSEATVRNSLTSIFVNLHVSGRFELITYAHRNNLTLVSPPGAELTPQSSSPDLSSSALRERASAADVRDPLRTFRRK